MDHQYLPVDTVDIVCNCTNQRLVRMGECVLCVNTACLGAWVKRVSRKHKPAAYRVDMIAKISLENFEEYLSYFLAFAWRRVAEFAANGIGPLDIANSSRDYLRSRQFQSHEFPNSEATLPQDYTDDDFNPKNANRIITQQLQYLADPYGTPYMSARLEEVAAKVNDPILLFHWANELSTAEAALLTGEDPWDFLRRSEAALQEVLNAT